MDDEFGPVCDNPACADQIKTLRERIDELDNALAEASGALADAVRDFAA